MLINNNNNFTYLMVAILLAGIMYIVFIIGNLRSKSTQDLFNQTDLLFFISMAIMGSSLMMLPREIGENISKSKILLGLTLSVLFIYSHFESIKENNTIDYIVKTICLLTTLATVIWTNTENFKQEIINNFIAFNCSTYFATLFSGIFKILFIFIDSYIAIYLLFIANMSNIKSVDLGYFISVLMPIIVFIYFCFASPNLKHVIPYYDVISIILVANAILFSAGFNYLGTNYLNVDTILQGKTLLVLLTFLAMFIVGIYWILMYATPTWSGFKNIYVYIASFIIFLILILLYLNQTTDLGRQSMLLFSGNTFFNSPTYEFIINAIKYIPCLLYPGGEKAAPMNWPAIFWIIVIALIYFGWRFVKGGISLLKSKVQQMGGTPLTKDILDLNQITNLGPADAGTHGYAVSFWLYLNSNNVPTNSYTEIFSFGNNPNISYNSATNTLQVTCKKNISAKNLMDSTVENIVYIKPKVLLQKWTNVLFNFNGGTLDIFYDGELAKSIPNVVPYKSMDAISVGSSVNGGIKDIYYFNKPLNQFTISMLTNSFMYN